MRTRTALLAAAAVALAATTPAVAAPKAKPKPKPLPKLCNLLTDAKDDVNWSMGAGTVKSPALDIVSADIATGPTEMVAVLRVAKADTSADNYAKLGFRWRLGATGNGVRYEFEMSRGLATQTQRTSATVGGTAVAHTFSVVGDAFVWKFKRAAAPAMARPKIVWGDFGANSNVLSSTSDNAASERKYPDRNPSCVVAK